MEIFRSYLESVDDIYTTTCLIQVGTCCFTLSVGLFLAATTEWYAVYGLMLAIAVQLFIYCIFGTIIELKVNIC